VKMKHLAGGKIRGKHTSATDTAHEFLNRALKLDCVAGVSLGEIKTANGGRAVSATFRPDQTRVVAKICSASSVQTLTVFCNGHPEKVARLLEREWNKFVSKWIYSLKSGPCDYINGAFFLL
jgi:hypothetical protein